MTHVTAVAAVVFLSPAVFASNVFLNQNVMEVVFPRSRRKSGAGKALPYRDPFRCSYKPYWVPES